MDRAPASSLSARDESVTPRIVVATYERGDDQIAREACLETILAYTLDWRIAMLVFDTRGPHRDRRDRQFGWAVGAGGTWRQIGDPVAEVIEVGA
jgi:hypothetical protein